MACNSTGYQNMNARYNGYFYANQYLNEVYQQIEDSYEYNYNQILKIYPDIDSATIQGNKSKLDDAFKKASQVIEWYASSDWVDDNYLIIGKIRHLRAEFPLAVETLQYINQTSEDDPTRHRALIALMQTYMDAGDMENAKSVSNYLETEKLNEENFADHKVMLAYYFQRQEDYTAMAENLGEVSDKVAKKDTRSRINFILGQIAQSQGKNQEAFEFYKASLNGTPPYDLTFHAKLNMQQVSNINSADQIEKVRKFYASLLKDGKNKEYLGKIYYEMGEFEKKQSHNDLALNNYLKAVSVEEPSPRQKSLSYLRVGQLYFDIFEKFELASNYYDSATAIMPNDVQGYAGHLERKDILNEFVTHLKTIETNDSLLSLAQLNPVSLDAFLDTHLNDLEKAEKEKIKEERREVSNTGSTSSSSQSVFTGNTSGEWYFYNDAAVELGGLEFQRRWGNRPLEDNWRRASKESQVGDGSIEAEETNLEVNADPAQASTEKSARETEKAALLATIPTSPEAREKLHLENQEAYFKLGRVYRFGLERITKSATTYKTLLEKYPQTEYKLETLFALYTIYENSDASLAAQYKQQIINEFPESLIAKTLINPNYLAEKEARNKALQQVYASAYKAYENGDYVKADQILRGALSSFVDVDFLPTVELLAAILKGKTESLFAYEQALKNFVQKYPEGKLNTHAKELLVAINPVKETIIRNEDFEYSEDFRQLHLVAVVYNTGVTPANNLKKALENYNAEVFAHLKLNIAQLEFNKEKQLGIMYVNSFVDKKTAEAYYRALSKALDNFEIEVDSNFNSFAISRDNFQMLFQSKQLEAYLKFYKRFYQ